MGKGGCNATGSSAATVNAASANGTANASSGTNVRKVTQTVLAGKASVEECWIVYEGVVYDVTHWLAKHPGGIRSIMSTAGLDATSLMKSFHPPETLATSMKRLRKVGIYVPDDDDEPEMDTAAILSSSVGGKKEALGEETKNGAKRTRQVLSEKQIRERNEAINRDFIALAQKFEKDGWFDAMPFHYWAAVIRVVLFLIIGISFVLAAGSRGKYEAAILEENSSLFAAWIQFLSSSNAFVSAFQLVVGSTLLGFFFQNIAFMGHDAGHGSISSNFQIDLWIGLILGNFLTGIDVCWWKSTHYVHHAATNSLHDDPDIQHMPFLCFEERMADNPWSTYHGRFMPLDTVAKWFVPHQAWYFYPVMGIARINLYVQSFIYLYQTRPFGRNEYGYEINQSSNDSSSSKKLNDSNVVMDEVTGEVKEKYAWPKPTMFVWTASVVSLAGFWTCMFTLLSCLDFRSAVVCFSVMHLAAGILHVQILCSHVAMHYCSEGSGTVGSSSGLPRQRTDSSKSQVDRSAIEDFDGPAPAVGFFEWQALSTMDIACPPYMDWFHGGLQFQLEHHLFPRVPRWRLRKIMPLVDELFAKYDIPVVRVGFIEANRLLLSQLVEVGAKVAQRTSKEKNL